MKFTLQQVHDVLTQKWWIESGDEDTIEAISIDRSDVDEDHELEVNMLTLKMQALALQMEQLDLEFHELFDGGYCGGGVE